jgi:uncharacterized repeat protein (TIGR02543 family)
VKAFDRKLRLPTLALTAAAMMAGCPLPYEYNGPGGGNLHTSDPSTPSLTAPVTVSYSAQGQSGTISNNGTFTSGQTTTVTLSTATLNAVIYYTNDGSQVTNFGTAQKINGSSGQLTITRSTSVQTVNIHAVAIGPNMLPSQASQATVIVTPYPILSLTCSTASVSEDGGTATFTITSSSAPAAAITVKLLTGGTYTTADLTGFAASGTSFTATLAPATTTVSLPITGVHNPANANPTATLTIQPDSNTPPTYTVGTPSSASVLIQNDGAHTVTYNGNGSTSGTVPTDSNLYAPNATVTVLSNSGSLAKTGYTFAGWNTVANGSGTTYAPNQTFTMGSSNVTLYALWNVLQYTLTVTSSGSGTTSPAGAHTATYGVATSITATPGTGYYFLNWTVSAGSGATFGSTGTATSTSASDTVTLTSGNATIQANFFVRNYYVNASTGNDSNAGTSAAPFKTITKALSVATVSGQIVNAAAGTYNTANGETFPLYIPAGVTLTGNTAGDGSGVLIQGGGQPSVYSNFISAAVVMENQSVLEGFTVTNNSGITSLPEGVLIDANYSANGTIVTMNTITGNPDIGIYVRGATTGGSVNNNQFTANSSNDLAFVGGGGNGMSVSYNTFNDQVELDTPGADLGGGAASSPGHNSFLAASSTYFDCGGTVYAENDHWNHSPPTVGAVQSGYDVGVSDGTTVNTAGYY